MSDIEREEFEREERYIVVKINRLEDESEIALREFLQSWQIDTEQCVVVEHDWPNYEHTWDTIQQVADGTWQSSREAVSVPEWIKCSDRMPAERCLMFTDNDGLGVMYRIIPAGLVNSASDGTHWMPLPKPPKQEQGK